MGLDRMGSFLLPTSLSTACCPGPPSMGSKMKGLRRDGEVKLRGSCPGEKQSMAGSGRMPWPREDVSFDPLIL